MTEKKGMSNISQAEFDKAAAVAPEEIKDTTKEISEEEIAKLLEEMQNPVQAQQRLAVQVKHFLDNRIKEEMKEKGFLTDATRRWVESYNSILEKIQKALYGDKNVTLNLTKVTHSQIATKMREAENAEKHK